jgi:hypothetical protein
MLQRAELSLGRHFDWLAEAAETEFERLLSVLHWIRMHPDSGLYLRQLPIPGVDTKWLAANRTRVCDLLRQLTGQDGDLHRLAGLRREPDLLRLRILDPALRAVVGGLSDLSAPVNDIAALPLRPQRVLIVENLQTGLAMTDLPGTLCLMARGYAVEVFSDITWLAGLPLPLLGRSRHPRLRHPEPLAAPPAAGPVPTDGCRHPARPPGPLATGRQARHGHPGSAHRCRTGRFRRLAGQSMGPSGSTGTGTHRLAIRLAAYSGAGRLGQQTENQNAKPMVCK